MTHYEEFLKRVIDDGIVAAEADYAKSQHKREGAVAGFNACRDKTPAEIVALWDAARTKANEMLNSVRDDKVSSEEYWKARCYEAEIEWVANVVSAALHNQGEQPLAAHLPTVRGYIKAAEILGVAGAT